MSRSVTERTGGGVTIDTTPFRDLAKQLRSANRAASRNLRRELRAAGELVAAGARIEAGKHSKTIPPTIKVRVAGATVEVRAGGGDVAIASLFELGNTGHHRSASISKGGTFRHPVFGNREVWVNQFMHPFMRTAELAARVELRRMVGRSLTNALKEAGLKPEGDL